MSWARAENAREENNAKLMRDYVYKTHTRTHQRTSHQECIKNTPKLLLYMSATNKQIACIIWKRLPNLRTRLVKVNSAHAHYNQENHMPKLQISQHQQK